MRTPIDPRLQGHTSDRVIWEGLRNDRQLTLQIGAHVPILFLYLGAKEDPMLDSDTAEFKTHYICQTYSMNKSGLKVEKLLQYTSASQAEERAEREARAEGCAGADAYMLTEDPNSGEVSQPMFLARHGNVPEIDAF